MKRDLTELVFILDRSGSMNGLEGDTIGGFNSLLKKQKQEKGSALVTTVLFDDAYELLHDRISINGIDPITTGDYYVRGTTALLDAVGRTIQKIVNVQRHTSTDEQAENVIFVIITDGMENASREYSYDRVRKMINYQKAEYGWEFIFLGANIDAAETARQFGISRDRASNYNPDGEGTRLNYQVLSDTVSMKRARKVIDDDWKDRIDKDYKQRKKDNKF
ncbi:vWA domain-containing protein [Gudongella sp. SC589]|uniref:vWA domain-containing protein n=1 Tax=Gudongella sp. SC589 TaxID=3385990 RepID=UPI0039049FC0